MTIAIQMARLLPKAVRTGIKAFRLPPILGKAIYSQKTAPLSPVYYHGTALTPDIERQIRQGRFDNLGRDIYSGNLIQAAHFGHQHSIHTSFPCVILKISSKLPLCKNRSFNTYYFSRGPHQKVQILAAYHLSSAFIEAGKKTLTQRFREGFNTAKSTIFK